MKKLSIVIITLNEEESIGKCIDSIKEIADEIIVVDSLSTDRTTQIAEAKGAKIFLEKFRGYTEQKNLAIVYSTCDYVFSLDADEIVSEELLHSIKDVKQLGFPADAYEMNRLNFLGKRAVKTCGWYPDTKVRLWKKNVAEWKGGLVHEEWKPFEQNLVTSLEKLKGDILHYTYQTKEGLILQTERFADLAAQSFKEKNIFYLLFKLLFSTPFKFIRNYFFKLGFTEGEVGFIICYQQSREVFLKYYRAIKLKYQ